MTLQACAELVQRGDPDRFLAAMAAPPAARRVLFPLYAFNIEVSRAPWVTQEPMIAEMRLQWWRDALEEIGARGVVRSHEVVTTLAPVLDGEGARVLDRLVAARRWDVHREAFEDADALREYLDHTAGGLMWAGARALGAGDAEEAAVRRIGFAGGVAALLQAVPALEASGRKPLVDGRPEGVAALAREALEGLKGARVSAQARPATLPAWQARALLRQAVTQPGRVGEGSLGLSEFSKRARLMKAALTGV